MLKLLLRKFGFNFAPFAVSITLLCFLVYGVGQQIYRTGANDPQIEIAHKVVELLNAGMEPKAIVRGEPVDMAKSLSLHISVFDNAGKPVASTALFNNQIPVPPAGSLETARRDGENIFSWQPGKDARCAAVVLPYNKGTVVVGKSLRIAEERTGRLGAMVLVAWLFIMLAVAATMVMVIYLQFNVLRNMST